MSLSAALQRDLASIKKRGKYPSGQIVHAERKPRETEESILSVGLNQPHRRGVRNPQSALHGHAFGKLLITEQITPTQYGAGDHWARVTIAYQKHVTGSLPQFPSILANRLGTGGGGDPDIDKIRRDHADLQGYLMDTGEWYDANRLLTKVCIMDVMPTGDKELGTIRVGLNSIARMIG